MHRRVRHLNPAQCGAQIALDARFLSGIADGAAVTTWTSRAVATITASQGTLANRPLYRLDGINGQSAVDFDGSNDYMTFGSVANSLTNNVGSGDQMLVALRDGSTGTTGYMIFFSNALLNTSARFGIASRAASVDGIFATGRRLDADSGVSTVSAGDTDPAFIGENNARWSDGVLNAARNGVKTATASYSSGSGNTSATNSLAFQLGANFAASQFFNGRISAVVVAVPAFSDPLRNRVRQSLGFSFKIGTI